MPTGEPQAIALMPGQVYVPTDNGLFINISVGSDGTPEAIARIPAALQQIVDLFQDWPGRHPLANVTGQLYDTTLAAVTPAKPLPDPDPPADPPVQVPAPSPVVDVPAVPARTGARDRAQ